MPFIGASALAMARIRPGTLGAVGGRKPSSTPSRITRVRAGSTPKSRTTSRREASEGVITSGIRRATRACIRTKPYQRRIAQRRRRVVACASSIRRSKVIGWWIVATTGSPARSTSSRPSPRVWLSWTTSKSSTRSASSRATRRLKLRGSGKPPTHIVRNSRTSTRSRNSRSRGTRNGSGSR